MKKLFWGLALFAVLAAGIWGIVRLLPITQASSGLFVPPVSPSSDLNFSTGMNPFLGVLSGIAKYHLGVDYNGVDSNNVPCGDCDAGSEIRAAYDGTIAYVGPSESRGYMIALDHALPSGRHVCSYYFHMQDAQRTGYFSHDIAPGSPIGASFAKGMDIMKGQAIGRISNTYKKYEKVGAHLHFEIATNWPRCKDDFGLSYSSDKEIINTRIDPDSFFDGLESVVVPLGIGWNQFRIEHGAAVDMNGARVVRISSPITNETALHGNIEVGSFYRNQNPNLSSAYDPTVYEQNGNTVTFLQPGKYYWIYTYQDTLTLVLYGQQRQKFFKGDVVVTNTPGANIRRDHNTDQDPIATLTQQGSDVQILDEAPFYDTKAANATQGNVWWRVLYPNAKLPTGPYYSVGWMNEDVIDLAPSTSCPVPPPTHSSAALAALSSDSCASPIDPSAPPEYMPTIVSEGTPIMATQSVLYLSSVIDGHGENSTYWYDYGTDISYGQRTGLLPINYYIPDHNASYLLSGLPCGTTYHYRIAGQNIYGVTYGKDRIASTAACTSTSPTPTPSVGQKPGSLTLWNETPYCTVNDPRVPLRWSAASEADGYVVYRDGFAQGGSDLPPTATSFENAIPPGYTYSYYVYAFNRFGSTTSNVINVTVPGDVCPPPPPPTGNPPIIQTLSYSELTINNVRFHALVNPNGENSTDVWFEYGTTSALGSSTIPRSYGTGYNALAASFSIGPKCDNIYYYRAVAQNAIATVYGSTMSFVALPCTIAPPSDLVGNVTPDGVLSLAWKDNSAIEENIRVQRNHDGGIYGSDVWVGPNATSWTTNASDMYPAHYCYRVMAYAQAQGSSAPSNSVCFDLPVPKPVNNAACTEMRDVPDTIVGGTAFTPTVSMKNSGTKAWTSDTTPHRLGSESPKGNLTWGIKRVALPSIPIDPGQTAAFRFTAKAPTTAGSYKFDWRMVEDGVQWFGEMCSKTVTVVAPPPTLVNGAGCNAMSAPDSVTAGAQFAASVSMINTGTNPWTVDKTPHRLGSESPKGTTRWGIKRIALPYTPIAPGEIAKFAFTATAPTTPGSYKFDWRMVEDGVQWFGNVCSKLIPVK